MAHFDGEPFDRAGDHTQHGEEHRVAVTRDDLGGDGLDCEPQFVGDVLLDRRVYVGESAHSAGNRTSGDLFARGNQALSAAAELGVGFGELQAEGDRLGVDAVAAADGRRVLVLFRAALDRRQEGVEILQQDVGRLHELDVERGVQHVGAGHPLVHETCFGADLLRDPVKEGDDIVLGDGLDRVDRGDVDLRVGRPPVPQGLSGGCGHRAHFPHLHGGVRFDLEPDAITRFGFPDRGHRGAGVAGDHVRLLGLTQVISANSRGPLGGAGRKGKGAGRSCAG